MYCMVYRVQITAPHTYPFPLVGGNTWYTQYIYTGTCACMCVCARAHIYSYVNRVWRVVLAVFSTANLYFLSFRAAIVFLRAGKRDKVLTALLVLRYTRRVLWRHRSRRRGVRRYRGGWVPSRRRRKILLLPPLVPSVRACISVRWWRCVFKYH